MTTKEMTEFLQARGWKNEKGRTDGMVWRDPQSYGVYFLDDAYRIERSSKVGSKSAKLS
jgi:hypothetical protein